MMKTATTSHLLQKRSPLKKIVTLLALVMGILSRSMEPGKQLTNNEIKAIYDEASKFANSGDFQKAEELLLSIESQDPVAHYSLTKIARNEYLAKPSEAAAQKLIRYASMSVEDGYPNTYVDMAFGYEELGEYKKAKEYYKKALAFDTPDMYIALEYAAFLFSKFETPENAAHAVQIYRTALKKNHPTAIFSLAVASMLGKGTPVQIKESFKLFSQIISDPNNIYYNDSCSFVGIMYERGLLDNKSNLDKAVEYFQKDRANGKVHIARLIWTHKINGNKEESIKDIEAAATNGSHIALYLYSTILINQGEIEKGIHLLINHYKRLLMPTPTLVRLQIAIAYQDGWGGLEENQAFAEKEFNMITSITDASTRSELLAKAYMYIMGLGVSQDIDKGFRLLEESKKKYDDVFFDTYTLFPALKKIEEEYHNKKWALQQELFAEDKESESKKPKGKHKAQTSSQKKSHKQQEHTERTQEGESSSSQAASTITTKSEQTPKDIFDTTLDYWNNFWAKNGDGSLVSQINRTDHEITINDPKRDEQLIVRAEQKPYSSPQDLTELIYDPRIKKREDDDRAKGQTNHIFAKILDYVIQCTGKLGLFAKDASDEPKDLLIAFVTRINTKTGKRTPCKAEYTFYKDHQGKPHLYHRLLRQIKP